MRSQLLSREGQQNSEGSKAVALGRGGQSLSPLAPQTLLCHHKPARCSSAQFRQQRAPRSLPAGGQRGQGRQGGGRIGWELAPPFSLLGTQRSSNLWGPGSQGHLKSRAVGKQHEAVFWGEQIVCPQGLEVEAAILAVAIRKGVKEPASGRHPPPPDRCYVTLSTLEACVSRATS